MFTRIVTIVISLRYVPPVPTHEDHFHILRCPDPRRQWFTTFQHQVKGISQRCFVSAPLLKLLVAACDLVILQCPIPRSAIDPSVQQVYDGQSEIGWDQILFGRFHKRWQERHVEYLRYTKRHKGKAIQWIPKICELILTTVLKQWKLRNDHQHGTTPESCRAASLQQSHQILQALYRDRVHVPNPLQLSYYPSVDIHKAKQTTPYKLKRWLGLWTQTLRSNLITDGSSSDSDSTVSTFVSEVSESDGESEI